MSSRYPDHFLTQLLERVDLVDVISPHVELKRSGGNLFGLCPFHHEKSPSFSVSPEKQMFYCFGCGKGGSAFQFVMEYHGLSFPEAVAHLAEKAGIPLPERTGATEKSGASARNDALLRQVAERYQAQLRSENGQEAMRYLRQRGLPEAIIEAYGLGFAPPGYGFLQRCFAQEEWKALEAQGMLFRNERGYGDRFRGRIMFPIRNARGRIVGFGGRIVGEGEPKYLNSPETEDFRKSELLYGLAEHREHIRRQKRLLIVEGYMDVLMLAAHQMPIAVAPLGTAIGETQLRMLFRLCEAPLFCFDGDAAGRRAAWRALQRMLPLLRAEWEPRFLYLPTGEDPDSLLRAQGADGMQRQIDSAVPVLEAWLRGLREQAGSGPEGRARMAKQADRMLQELQDPFLREAWRQAASAKSGIALAVEGMPSSLPRKRREQAPWRKPRNQLQERFLAALFQQPERFHALPEDACNFTLDDEEMRLLYNRALSLSQSEGLNGKQCLWQLQRMFPEDKNIPRWLNETPVSDIEFTSIILDMRRAWLERLASEADDVAEKLRIRRQLTDIRQQQRELAEQLESERRGNQ